MPATQDAPNWDSKSSIDDADELVSKNIVAEYLHLTTQTIDTYRRLGLIPYIKIGGAIRFRLADVKAAIRNRYTVREVSR
jgi:hypothetical protein